MENRKRVLIFGTTGMAGHVIYEYLSSQNKYDVIGTSNRKNEKFILLDVTNFIEVERIIKETKPHFIINAVGILIKGSDDSASNAILINSYFPHFISQLCVNYNCKLLHISTDCVFSGNEGNYKEDSFKDGDDIYARSKSLGEVINTRDVTIRTSIIGPELKNNGEGLFHWFMNQNGQINGYANAYWSGVTTLELAKAIDDIISNDIVGIFHLTNNMKISKYDLLNLFNDIRKSKVFINRVDNALKDKSFINTKYPNRIVSNSYEDMLIELYSFMKEKKHLFNYAERYSL